MLFLYGRLKVYKAFKEGQKRILVATDLVGRGIDIERVNIVINYDMPETDERHGNGADTYLHRVRFYLDAVFSQHLISHPGDASRVFALVLDHHALGNAVEGIHC